jgi:hypothetical protein
MISCSATWIGGHDSTYVRVVLVSTVSLAIDPSVSSRSPEELLGYIFIHDGLFVNCLR